MENVTKRSVGRAGFAFGYFYRLPTIASVLLLLLLQRPRLKKNQWKFANTICQQQWSARFVRFDFTRPGTRSREMKSARPIELAAAIQIDLRFATVRSRFVGLNPSTQKRAILV